MNTLEITAQTATETGPEIAALVAADSTNPAVRADCAGPMNPAVRADPNAFAEWLAQAPPSAGLLDELEFELLGVDGCVDAVVASERAARHAHAGVMRSLGHLLARIGGHARATEPTQLAYRLAESEVCAALAWSPATAQSMLYEADALTRRFPTTLHLLDEGKISIRQARSLTELTTSLEDDIARAVEARVIARMPGQSNSATRQAIRRAIVRADPDAAAKRHEHERTRRRVELRPEDDGMATLSFYLPAEIAQMAMRTLTDLAQGAKRKNPADKRTLDQRRADMLPALLSRSIGTTARPLVPAHVNVVVGIETLLGLSHEPGHLQGYGPICPEQTRRLATEHASRWRFLLTASDGTLIDASPRTYKPTAAVKRITELKRTTCAFPHCTMPSERCDIDHNHPFDQGGPPRRTTSHPSAAMPGS